MSARPPLVGVEASALAQKPMRYFDFMMAAFVTILLLSNLIGAAKQAVITLPVVGPWNYGAGVLFFPVSYILGDVLTEVYGYARARRCVWVGFFALLFMVVMSLVVVNAAPAAGWALASDDHIVLGHHVTAPNQAAYEAVFGMTPRIVLASMVAFWAGEFVNSFVLARMKVWTGGRKLWTRTVGSTLFGQAVDSALFYPLAFFGAAGWSLHAVLLIALTQWALKVAWEVLLTPVTYAVVGFLKRAEGVDVFDRETNFTPFRTRV